MKTEIQEYIQADGTSRWRLHIRYDNGRRRRLRFDSKKAAMLEAESLHNQIKIGGNIWASLTARQQAEMLFVFKEARDLGVTMFDLLECYKKSQQTAVTGKNVSLRQLVQETINTARAKNCSSRYIDTLGWALYQFIDGRETLPVQHVTFQMIEEWLAGQKGRWKPGHERAKASPSTIRNLRANLSAMFSEAVRRDYIYEAANPMRKVIRAKITHVPPQFLTAKSAHDLLWVCRVTSPPYLPYLALGMFAGIRPEELEKLHWNHIDLDRGEILIDESVGKGARHRRIIEMKVEIEIDGKKVRNIRPEFAALNAWLNECQTKTGYVVPIDGDRKNNPRLMRQIRQWVQRHRKRLSVRAGVTLSQDVLRKTACTYLMVWLENENKVAMILGNSPKVIYTHYRGLTRRDQADAFLNLTPDKVKNDPLILATGGQGKCAGKIIP